jgi:hypothetical protein
MIADERINVVCILLYDTKDISQSGAIFCQVKIK